ncbi:hypothetical protein BRD04_07430 [Halobacteriales archaeon QS_9_67_17]|nr:MAG: hypothetical protein BRD04_07430 [Halobacteriales archaeon QS_9_67_17]
MSLASDTRDAVRRRPFLHAALAAGIVNYTAAARYLDVGDEEPVAAALRRYAEDLPDPDHATDARVDMQSGVGRVDPSDALVTVGDAAFGPDQGDLTAIIATGEVGPSALGRVLARLDIEGIAVEATAGAEGYLVCLVDRTAGVDALRYVEETLGA